MKQQISSLTKILSCGDCITFELELDHAAAGQAFLRTNLGGAAVARREIIAKTENEQAILARDWHDVLMNKRSDKSFALTLPLLEVGCFEAKLWFKPAAQSSKPMWAEGDNLLFKVEPPEHVCGNTIYSVFPRCFADKPSMDGNLLNEAEALLDNSGYNVIPPSGTFRDVIKQLDFIIGELGSRIIQLLPIHPTPTCYGKMGRYGSPFASLDYFSVDPALAEFDLKATPLEQFIELVDAVHARQARVFIDIPVNHTGWASRLHTEHPEYFIRRDDNSFVSPGAWGTVWADLCKLDYERAEVHALMAEVFLYWCRKGVDGFRCDAGYMLPASAWDYIVAKVRNEYPATIFMLEGLGGPLDVQANLLEKSGLNWAYSELFQNYTKQEIEAYLPYSVQISHNCGLLVNFAETHDNNRLAAVSQRHAEMRTALTALLSCNGTFGITNGVEWFADEKIDVHNLTSLNWGSKSNQVKKIKHLQQLLENYAVFYAGATIEVIPSTGDSVVVVRRVSTDQSCRVLILINLDENCSRNAIWHNSLEACPYECVDLVSEKRVVVEHITEQRSVLLDPGAVLCLIAPELLIAEIEPGSSTRHEPLRVNKQRMRAMALAIKERSRTPFSDFSDIDVDQLAHQLGNDPEKFCNEQFPAVTIWQEGMDQQRALMVPPGDMLLVISSTPFRVELKSGDITENMAISVPTCGQRRHFVIFPALTAATDKHRHLQLRLQSFSAAGTEHSSGELILLADPEQVKFNPCLDSKKIKQHDNYALCSNDLGGMAQVRAAWGTIKSKYDALLAANCNAEVPVDRQVMFTRCRAWLVCNDYSQELNLSCLDNFIAGNRNRATWNFSVPVGQGKLVRLRLILEMAEHANCIRLVFYRLPAEANDDVHLADSAPLKIILRPDIEDRCNHEITRAFAGAEECYPAAIKDLPNGFSFAPSNEHRLELKISAGQFIHQPEWLYMVALPVEQERGLDAHTDLFSPGYFTFGLKGGEQEQLTAAILLPDEKHPADELFNELPEVITTPSPETTMYDAMRRFIVRRDNFHTVIAGYPWFLDWGRDTLICLRGMIAAGYLEQSREIIIQFARFEKFGTIPNMIRGNDDGNRDTSDAPLWLFVAVREFCLKSENRDILQQDCGGRKLEQVLCSVAEYYRNGTPNGIVMDHTSGLIFSPSHFTWMDTNYPAGTPREGYPVEIQALWYAALSFLAELNYDWAAKLKRLVRDSITSLYYLEAKGHLADCLHAKSGQPASQAVQDDACRPNQLFVVTLAAVESTEVKTAIVKSCAQLIVPGAIRSLADQSVTYPLPVYHNGKLLNNPVAPYWGNYSGDEDTRRKPAYHNGTAWCWPFPSYCEALLLDGAGNNRQRSLALLMSCQELFDLGPPGQLPEIIDGNFPHQWRGCGAQAWSVTEFYRVYKLLTIEA